MLENSLISLPSVYCADYSGTFQSDLEQLVEERLSLGTA